MLSNLQNRTELLFKYDGRYFFGPFNYLAFCTFSSVSSSKMVIQCSGKIHGNGFPVFPPKKCLNGMLLRGPFKCSPTYSLIIFYFPAPRGWNIPTSSSKVPLRCSLLIRFLKSRFNFHRLFSDKILILYLNDFQLF